MPFTSSLRPKCISSWMLNNRIEIMTIVDIMAFFKIIMIKLRGKMKALKASQCFDLMNNDQVWIVFLKLDRVLKEQTKTGSLLIINGVRVFNTRNGVWDCLFPHWYRQHQFRLIPKDIFFPYINYNGHRHAIGRVDKLVLNKSNFHRFPLKNKSNLCFDGFITISK